MAVVSVDALREAAKRRSDLVTSSASAQTAATQRTADAAKRLAEFRSSNSHFANATQADMDGYFRGLEADRAARVAERQANIAAGLPADGYRMGGGVGASGGGMISSYEPAGLKPSQPQQTSYVTPNGVRMSLVNGQWVNQDDIDQRQQLIAARAAARNALMSMDPADSYRFGLIQGPGGSVMPTDPYGDVAIENYMRTGGKV